MMWGNLLEKAKGLAENLDKQLNESVGLDADPKGGGTTPSTAPAAVSSASSSSNHLLFSATPSEAAPAALESIPQDTADINNAWNDNFDFDDEDEEGLEETTTSSLRTDTEPQLDAIHVEAKEDTAVATATTATSDPAAGTPPVTPATTASVDAPSQEAIDATTLWSSIQPSVKQDDEEPIGSGWDGGDDNLDLDLDEAQQDDVPNAKEENHGEIPSGETANTTDSAIDDPTMGTLATTDPVPLAEVVESEAPVMVPIDEPAKPAPVSSSPVDLDVQTEKNLPTSSSKKGSAAFGSMFSSLANTAEALAHQAETLGKGTSGVASIFSAFPLASTAPTRVAETDYSVFDASASGWAEGTENLELEDSNSADEDYIVSNEWAKKQNETVEARNGDVGSNEGPIDDVEDMLPHTDELTEPHLQSAEPLTLPPVRVLSQSSPVPVMDIEADPRYQQLVEQLRLRENQLSNKSNQLTELQQMMEQQEKELKQKLAETKEEAKKRILSAKERCEAAEAKVQSLQNAQSSDSASQTMLIQALREEGEKLALKQSAMEQAVRAARTESRNFQEQLEIEQEAKNKGLQKIAKLESDLKSTKESLSSARKGELQASKLDQELMTVRSDAEMKAATILSLQQQVKELTAEGKEWQLLLEKARKEAQKEVQHETKTLRREHNDIISDLETKLRTTEREAGVREDALRHEVSELRKRWEDAVRRADALSMDVQSSTAPLLRQLEGMERQNRLRAANWTELENRLRSELEESVIQNETLTKERSEFKTKCSRFERLAADNEQDLKQSKRTVEEQAAKISKLENRLEEMEAQVAKREEDYSKVERLANEGVMRVRSEMTQTVVDSEERYRSQIKKLENELREEHDKKYQLEKQVAQLLENSGLVMMPAAEMVRREAKPKRLRQAEGQAQILAGALGLDSDSDDDGDDDDSASNLDGGMDHGEGGNTNGGGSLNSFAALDQLTSKLKANAVELESLKRNLRESERARESLVEELGESRVAKEKLPLFEAKVKELTQENREMEMEIQGLREDIADVREMYRAQLNILLEDKASQMAQDGSDGQ